MTLEEMISKMEDTHVECVHIEHSQLTEWLKELRDARNLIKQLEAALEGQSRYIQMHIDRGR